MGLSQKIIFSANRQEIINLLLKLDYRKVDNKYIKASPNMNVEVFIEPFGLYIHRSGEYFTEFGILIESLGNITEQIIIEDQ
jgi:hypothetical protein